MWINRIKIYMKILKKQKRTEKDSRKGNDNHLLGVVWITS